MTDNHKTVHISTGLYRVMQELIKHYKKHHVPCSDCQSLQIEKSLQTFAGNNQNAKYSNNK